jgi:hypothetical protein
MMMIATSGVLLAMAIFEVFYYRRYTHAAQVPASANPD